MRAPAWGRRQEEQHRIRADAPDTRARPRPTGAALLANPTTEVPATDAEVLAGQVDPRPLSLLAAIGARLGLGLQGLPAVPGARLDARQEPYAPDRVSDVDGGLLLGYPTCSTTPTGSCRTPGEDDRAPPPVPG